MRMIGSIRMRIIRIVRVGRSVARTERHQPLAGSRRLVRVLRSSIGTWIKRSCRKPMTTPVLPAIAACTALRAKRSQSSASSHSRHGCGPDSSDRSSDAHGHVLGFEIRSIFAQEMHRYLSASRFRSFALGPVGFQQSCPAPSATAMTACDFVNIRCFKAARKASRAEAFRNEREFHVLARNYGVGRDETAWRPINFTTPISPSSFTKSIV